MLQVSFWLFSLSSSAFRCRLLLFTCSYSSPALEFFALLSKRTASFHDLKKFFLVDGAIPVSVGEKGVCVSGEMR